MSLKEIVEPVYTQIFDRSARVNNTVIRAIDDTITAGTFTLGSSGNLNVFIIGGSGSGANTALDVVSTSAADVRNTGTGARKVTVEGLFTDIADSNKRKPRTCIFNMNGTTIVNTGAGITGTNSFCAVNKITVLDFGNTFTNQGVITVKKTGTATVFGILQLKHFSSKSMFYATAHDEQLLIKDIHISSSLATASSVELFEQDLQTGGKKLIGKLFVGNNHSDINHPLNFKVGKTKAFYATITTLESVISTNHISANVSAISI